MYPPVQYVILFFLLKGGSGRRKLVVIPPEAEGYSAKTLRSMSSGGKATFYIVPLQESLDTSPLAPDSPHFSKMPKTSCYQCNEVMPLQMLAVHIRTCIGKLSSDDDNHEDQVRITKVISVYNVMPIGVQISHACKESYSILFYQICSTCVWPFVTPSTTIQK